MSKIIGKPALPNIETDEDPGVSLLQQIAGGDESALETLFHQFGDRLFSYILRIVNNESVAEDVLQETLIIVWKQAGKYRGKGCVLAWLFGIARNKAMRTFRQRENLPLNDLVYNPSKNRNNDPENRIDKHQREEYLRDGLNNLSSTHREVLDLFFLYEMKIKEIAGICGIPIGTVKSRLNQARKELKNTLIRQGLSMEDLI